jgi:hypothetical protein
MAICEPHVQCVTAPDSWQHIHIYVLCTVIIIKGVCSLCYWFPLIWKFLQAVSCTDASTNIDHIGNKISQNSTNRRHHHTTSVDKQAFFILTLPVLVCHIRFVVRVTCLQDSSRFNFSALQLLQPL